MNILLYYNELLNNTRRTLSFGSINSYTNLVVKIGHMSREFMMPYVWITAWKLDKTFLICQLFRHLVISAAALSPH